MRTFSVPERLGGFGAGAAVVVPVLPTVHRVTGFSLACPLRTMTGVPCPFCGMTTAAEALATGQVSQALAANPFILGVVALAGAGVVMLALRSLGLVGTPIPWTPRARRRLGWVAGLLATGSWAFQLHRFGFT